MPLTPEQVAFLEGPNSLVVGTQDGRRVPEATRALALRHEAGDRVTVYLPAGSSDQAVANLAREPRIAVGVSRPSTHKTYQLKGRALEVKPAPADAQPALEQAFAAFVQEAAAVGLPPRLLQPVVYWPAVMVLVEVSEVYDQTPGPGAGGRCP